MFILLKFIQYQKDSIIFSPKMTSNQLYLNNSPCVIYLNMSKKPFICSKCHYHEYNFELKVTISNRCFDT